MARAGKAAAVCRVVDEVIRLIECRADGSHSWFMSVDEFIAIVDIKREELYRALYAKRDSVDEIAPSGFGPANVQDMILLLGEFFGPAAAVPFSDSGITLSFEDKTALMEKFVFEASRTFGRHIIEEEEFKDMLRTFGKINRAIATYIEHYFDIHTFTATVAREFVEARSFDIPRLAELNAAEYIMQLVKRNVLSPRGLLSAIESKLRSIANPEKNQREKKAETERDRALSTFGLPYLPADKAELRRHYKVLMKTYHPDVNPSGLELCKKLNNAYMVLQSSYEG